MRTQMLKILDNAVMQSATLTKNNDKIWPYARTLDFSKNKLQKVSRIVARFSSPFAVDDESNEVKSPLTTLMGADELSPSWPDDIGSGGANAFGGELRLRTEDWEEIDGFAVVVSGDSVVLGWWGVVDIILWRFFGCFWSL